MKTFKPMIAMKLAVVLGFLGAIDSGYGATLAGQIGMMGKATLDGPLATATTITGFGRARVGYGTEDYVVPGTVAVNTPVVFTPMGFGAPPSEPMVLWEFTSGGSVYSFELHAWDFDCFEFDGNSFMNLSGTGFAFIDGARQTPADFSFSTQQSTDSTEAVVTWSAETIMRGVPEGGTSVFFLLFGIVGIEVLRKKLHTVPTVWVDGR